MKKIFAIVLLGVTGLILLAVVGLGVFLATFDPNAYKGQLSAAVEKATGRSVQFQSALEVSFFPTLGLKTGHVAIVDPDIFGGEPFLSVESAFFQVSLRSLLDRTIEVEEVVLRGVRLDLVTNAVGQHNWEYGFARDSGPGSRTGVDAGATPLQAPDGQSGSPGTFTLKIQELSFTDTRVSYRDLQKGAAYSGRLEPFTLHKILHPDAEIPIALSGTAQNDNGKEKVRFDLRGELRDGAEGILSVEMRRFDIQGDGFGVGAFHLQGEAAFRHDRNQGLFALSGLRGSLSLPSRASVAGGAAGAESGEIRTQFSDGRLTFIPAKGLQNASIDGGIALTELDVDRLQRRLGAAAAPASASDAVSGAPNLTRPTVSKPQQGSQPDPKLDPQLAKDIAELSAAKAKRDKAEQEAKASAAQAAKAKKTAAQTSPQWIDGRLAVTVQRIIVGGLPIRNLRLEARSEKETVTMPFSMSLFKGAVTGTAKAGAVKEGYSLALFGEIKGLDLAEATDPLSGKYTITGLLDASCNLTGRGGAPEAILNSLSGTIRARAGSGEVRGFNLIPGNLPGIRGIPVNFPYESLSASAKVEQGVAQSRDIALQSSILVLRGGGKVFLARAQADLGLEFLLGGRPPAIPVHISGPFGSLSFGVDMRTFMRNAAESAVGNSPGNQPSLSPPDAARELLRNIGTRVLR